MEREAKQNEGQMWYACYGSNINIERFMKYIETCDDKTPPIEYEKYEFKYDIYFAGTSRKWDEKAVAFLDDTKPGHAYGKIYKISSSQFEQIKSLEGESYKKEMCLGEFENLPVYTFTSPEKRNDSGIPSDEYFDTILKGLKDLYNEKTSEELEAYLKSSIYD